jgi:hypothetical protein
VLSPKEENDQFPKHCCLKRTGMMDYVQNISQKDCYTSSFTKFRLSSDLMLFAITAYFTRLAAGLKQMHVCAGLCGISRITAICPSPADNIGYFDLICIQLM